MAEEILTRVAVVVVVASAAGDAEIAVPLSAAAERLSECGRAAQYAKMTERIRMVKESTRRNSSIHCLVRFVEVNVRLRMGLGGFCRDEVVDAVSVSLDLLKFSLIPFLVSTEAVADFGGGGK